jgi:hypothetical protein
MINRTRKLRQELFQVTPKEKAIPVRRVTAHGDFA